ncbi:hypothetical protein AUJ73_01565 [Candidatus Gottesmanbacteria bacterium CG1_02_37_22]|uniref:Uncharacterized protein n=1 Tax=Candidatus Gottesmanbacteria bacterium CG1_02_37_22 TaxID=1805209 RepID=A0A1J4TV09_9BACT|nr:MAG: hypothetical protein AUJ73_01565 [Candidatus Gottesmanbacteria bacterium CG1_02_37_22]
MATIGSGGTAGTSPKTPVTSYGYQQCYNPEPEQVFTLSWPENFTDLTDYRPALNPNIFPPSSFPSKFNSQEATCKNMILTNLKGDYLSPRNYIRVRKDLRVASCKTDELAGPYTVDRQECTNVSRDAASNMRGVCDITGAYPDLRKIAEVTKDGEVLEVFWTPYSHNVGCGFNEEKPNCGIGDGTNMNTKEFLYVLKKRDGFNPSQVTDCIVRWDENSHHNNPCSHYFDIYIAQDLYEKLQTVPTGPYVPLPTTDPEYEYDQKYHVFKQVMENCHEENTFTPITYPEGYNFPPDFFDTPFMTSGFASPGKEKIAPEPAEIIDYCKFVVYAQPVFIAQNSLHKINEYEIGEPGLPVFNECSPGEVAPNPNTCPVIPPDPPGYVRPSCFAKIGKIKLTNTNLTDFIFQVYASFDKPNNFYLKDTGGTYTKIFEYISTPDKPSQNRFHNPALQLTNLEFTAQAQWTWATPVCKPAIYLYPEKEAEMNVRLNVDGKITVSDPLYDKNYGWNVKAYPDGRIINKSDNIEHLTLLRQGYGGQAFNRIYPYLYYEADVNGVTLPKAGWVVKNSNLKTQISKIMKDIGFNGQEISDFLSYWLPRLTEKPYYFVSLMPEEMINRKETLFFSQTPDTLIRARFVFEGLNLPTFVTPLSIPKHTRSGFTVTDWGGTLVGESCSEVRVR